MARFVHVMRAVDDRTHEASLRSRAVAVTPSSTDFHGITLHLRPS